MSRALLAASAWVGSGPWADAYARAIRDAVRPGDVVINLSAGAGTHALASCRAGAARVYAVERDPELRRLIAPIAVENGFGSRIVAASSAPPAVDAASVVIVASILPAFSGIGGFVERVADARMSMPRVNARVVPERLRLVCAPVDVGRWYGRHVEGWSETRFGLSFHAGRRVAANTVWESHLDADACLAPPTDAAAFDLATCEPSRLLAELHFTIDRPGTLHAIAGWMDATLASGVDVSLRVAGHADACARPCLFPIDPPVAVEPGDVVAASLRMDPGAQPLWTWRVRVNARDVERADRRHSTFQALPIDLEGAAKERPDFVPALSERGRVELARLRRAE